MKVVYENKEILSSHFEGVVDLLDWEPNNVNSPDYKEILAGTRRDKRWFGPTNTSAKEVINHALLGDEALFKRHLKSKIDSINEACGVFTADYTQTIAQSQRRRVRRSMGDELDIHKVWQGKLNEAWSSTERIEVDREHKLVTLLCNIGGSASENAVSSLWRAAVATKLVGDFEKAGKSVQVLVGGITSETYHKTDKLHTTSIVVKKYTEGLPLERLAAMSHLGFYRTFCFLAKTAVDLKLDSGYGCQSYFSVEKRRLPVNLLGDIDAGHTRLILIDKCSDLSSAVSAIKKAERQIKSLN